MKKSQIDRIAAEDFITYSLDVDKDRAIPDIRDNLKPVHRHIIYSMYESKFLPTSKYVKSARAVGNIMGKYHPHGDSSIYDAQTRLAQDWKMRYPLIDMHGNKGSIDGDSAAAMRYTETRLSPVGMMMIDEISQHCVPMKSNYDESTQEPTYAPGRFPNIIANGSMGIGVGMSSSILPHNIKDTVKAIQAYIDNPSMDTKKLMTYLKGPDFPTGGTIVNANELVPIYNEGKGTIRLRSTYEVKKQKTGDIIMFTEIPYLMTLDKIKQKVLALYDEGDFPELDTILREDTLARKVDFRLRLKRNANLQKALNKLFDKCGLESTIYMNNTILNKDGVPERVSELALIKGYVEHRHIIITNIAKSQLVAAEKRKQVIRGLLIALQDIDGVVKTIKESPSRTQANYNLRQKYKLSELQADSILDMKLARLTSLETTKLEEEENELASKIIVLKDRIANKLTREKMIKEQLKEIKKQTADDRRTVLTNVVLSDEIVEEPIVLMLHDDNEITVASATDFSAVNRGGKGKVFAKESIKQIINCTTKDKIIFVDEDAVSYPIYGYEFEIGKQNNLSMICEKMQSEAVFMKVVKAEDFKDGQYWVTITQNGIVKKSESKHYKTIKPGFSLCKMKGEDKFKAFGIGTDDDSIIILTDGKMLKISFAQLKSAGRATMGVQGTKKKAVVSVAFASETDDLVFCSEKGTAKLVKSSDATPSTRGTLGVVSNSTLVYTSKEKEIFICGDDNKGIKIATTSISRRGLGAVGVKILNGNIKLLSL